MWSQDGLARVRNELTGARRDVTRARRDLAERLLIDYALSIELGLLTGWYCAMRPDQLRARLDDQLRSIREHLQLEVQSDKADALPNLLDKLVASNASRHEALVALARVIAADSAQQAVLGEIISAYDLGRTITVGG